VNSIKAISEETPHNASYVSRALFLQLCQVAIIPRGMSPIWLEVRQESQCIFYTGEDSPKNEIKNQNLKREVILGGFYNCQKGEGGGGKTKNRQIWLNLPSDDHHFFCIFPWMIGNSATNKKNPKKNTGQDRGIFFCIVLATYRNSLSK
jgi:hypothetical protein